KPSVNPEWPSEYVIAELVQKSSGHFIYPSTVIRYLQLARVNPEVALQSILELYTPKDPISQPLGQLDALYTHILQTAIRDPHSGTFDILQLLLYINLYS